MAAKETLTELLAPTATSLSPNPTLEKTRVAFEETEMRYVPSPAVWAPTLEPFTTTDTPANGDPSFASVTFPEIVLVCACATIANKHAKMPTKRGITSFLKFIFGSLLVY